MIFPGGVCLTMKRFHLLAVLALSWTAWSAQACTTAADCDDGNGCNGSETCQGGLCIPGLPMTCNDGNACTLDSCDPVTGCTFTTTTNCPTEGKKMRLGAGRELRLGLETGPDLSGLAFPANNTEDDPVIHGASLRAYTTYGDVFDNTYPMPSARWEYLGARGENKGYRYTDFHNVDGAITVAAVRDGKKNKLKARGPLLNFSLNTDPEPVMMVLRFGNNGRRYCMEFGGRTKFYRNARFTAIAAPPPPVCP